ncbi:MAG: nitroreductase family protein [Candidatus Micrarchaeia archaeon]
MLRELAMKRKSIRLYENKDVPDDMIIDAVSTAILAPSAGNLQAWEFIIVRRTETKRAIADACYGQEFIVSAPVVVIVCANRKRSSEKYGKRGEEFYSIADACIVASYFQLAVAEKGLGTVWVGAFDNDEIKSILDLPVYIEPIAVFPIGHPAEKGHDKRRFDTSKVMHMEKW